MFFSDVIISCFFQHTISVVLKTHTDLTSYGFPTDYLLLDAGKNIICLVFHLSLPYNVNHFEVTVAQIKLK